MRDYLENQDVIVTKRTVERDLNDLSRLFPLVTTGAKSVRRINNRSTKASNSLAALSFKAPPKLPVFPPIS